MGDPDRHIPIRVLGPLSVTAADGSTIEMSARKHAELLTILTVERSACSPARIADLLWRQNPPRSAPNTLQGYVSRLRKLLELTGSVRIDTVPAGYVLRCDGAGTDLDLLDRLSQDGLQLIRSDPAAGIERLTRALALWRGDPLIEISDIADYAPELVRLDDMRSELTETVADAHRTLGEHRRAVSLLTPLCHRHPYREVASRSLARALHDDGRTADALAELRRLRAALGDDLGLDPSAETAALEAELLSPTTPLTAPPPVPDSNDAPRLVGRSTETEMLDRIWRSGATRPTGVVLIGPSGIGKTALAEDLIARHGAAPRRFVGRPDAGATAFGAIEELIGGPARTEGATANLLADELTSTIFSDITGSGRAVLLLDDLQWIDRDSAGVLARVLSALPGAPVTVIAACRSADDAGAQIVGSALRRHGHFSELQVPELSSEDTETLIELRFRDLGIAPPVDRGELARQSLGHPVIAEQLCDAVALDAGRDLRHPAVTVVGRRLDELSAPNRRLLTLLAVAGGSLPSDVLDAVSDGGGVTAGADGARSGLARLDPDGTLRVAHDSVREALVATTSRTQRIDAHAQLAAALATTRPDEPAAVALHLCESAVDADSTARAALACLTSAASALDADADHLALDLARRGLRLPDVDESVTLELHRIAGSAATRVGEFASAEASFQAAAQLSRSRGDWAGLAATALLSAPHGVGGYWSGYGVVQSADLSLIREALAHSDQIDAEEAARLHATEAARLSIVGVPGAEDHLAAAQLTAAAAGGAVAYEIALADFLIRWGADTVEDRRKIARALYEMSAGDVHRRATALHLQRVCALEAGDLRLARRISTEYARLVDRRDGNDLHTMQVWWQVMLALLRGDYDASHTLVEQFVATLGTLSERARLLTEASVLTSRSIEAWHRGQLPSSSSEFDTLVDKVDDDFALVIALGAAEAGDLDRALQMATELTYDADQWTGPRVQVRAPLLIEALYAISLDPDHASAARDICRRLERFADSWSSGLIVQWPGLVCVGPASLYRGTVRTILGQDGSDDLREAVRIARDVGARPYLARAQQRLARLAHRPAVS